MQELRYEKIDGRDRRVFSCGCGKEIFYKKNGINFDKYLINDTSVVHQCNAIRKFDKECFDCGCNIKIYKVGNTWMKEDIDGTEHECDEKTLTRKAALKKNSNNSGKYWCHDCDKWHYPSHGFYSCVTDNPEDDY